MPEMRSYVVTQTRRVKVTANNELDAAKLAAVAFSEGTDANGGLRSKAHPDLAEVWGDTDTAVEVIGFEVSKR